MRKKQVPRKKLGRPRVDKYADVDHALLMHADHLVGCSSPTAAIRKIVDLVFAQTPVLTDPKLSPLEKLERIDPLLTDLEGEPLLIGPKGNVGNLSPDSL